MNTYRFLIIVENAGKNFSAYSPDLPGCVATGKTRDQAQKKMAEAIQLHIEGLKEDGLPIPSSTATAEYVTVAG
ncbi:MAG: type II toxin-antitoxin system HicB family antitoxin [Acidobacteriota bacterium]|nr:type II toxin-antitoxin system HicB family antitoxin [Acidobacteriota bacterium]